MSEVLEGVTIPCSLQRKNIRPNANSYFAELLTEAVDAYQYGVNWRPEPFQVGVSVLARRFNLKTGRYEYFVYADANNKPEEESGHRFCGEQYDLREVKRREYEEVLWWLIAAPTQIDDTAPPLLASDPEHEHHKTLKSCGYCRTGFYDLLLQYRNPRRPRLLTRHTLITSFNVHTRDLHTYNVGWLLRHYGVPDKRWSDQPFVPL